MKKILIFAILVFLFFVWGCTPKYAKVNGPFASYSHETFIKNDTGETGLYIDGEDWYALIKLDGFKDTDIKFSSPTQFLFQNKDGIIISCFAEKLTNVSDDKSCLDKVASTKDQKEINGRRVAMRDNGFNKSLYYAPYYKGYCFDFHFSLQAKDEETVFNIIDSIKFIDGKFSNARIKKYLYTYDKRIEFNVPDDWRISFDEKLVPKATTIKFLPVKGNSFEMLITPYGKIFGEPVSTLTVKQNALKHFEQLAQNTVDKPIFQELKNDKVNVFYYPDLEDKNYKQNVSTEFPFLCRGQAEIEGSAFYFSILYREKGGADFVDGINAIKNLKIFDLRK